MRILIITNVFHPDRAGGAAVFSDLAVGLADAGHDVTVYTAHPYYPEWQRKSSARPWAIERAHLRGVKVVRHGMFLPRRPSSLRGRLLYELSYTVSLLRSTFRDRHVDVVMVFCPLMGSVLFAVTRKVFSREPLWLNVQDIPADAARGSGLSTSPGFDRIATRLQSWLFRRCDVWSTLSPVMADRLATLAGSSAPPVRIIPNWLHESLAQLIGQLPPKEPALDGPLRLLYAGNIGMKQGLVDLCERLACCDLPFQLRICGDGGEAAEVRRWVHERRDDRFTMEGLLDEAGFASALHETDLFLITEKAGAGASFVPSKLIPALAVGTPILGVCDSRGPLGSELQGHSLGIQCEWDTLEEGLAEAATLSQRPERYRAVRDSCLRRARDYDREPWLHRISAQLEELAGARDDLLPG